MATSILKGVMHMNFKNTGWSESYYFPGTSYADAVENFLRLAKFRTTWFGLGVSLCWARISIQSVPNKRDAIALPLRYPLGPHSQLPSTLGPPEDSWTAWQYRLETADGRWVNRHFRGSPDIEITDLGPGPGVGVPEVLKAGNIVDPDGTTAFRVMQSMFNRALLQWTVHVRKIAAGNWELTPWARMVFVRIGKHNTGRPFGMFRGRAPKHAVA